MQLWLVFAPAYYVMTLSSTRLCSLTIFIE